jgi:squalene cyclase
MMERGVGFLLARQGDDGAWRDFLTLAGEGVDWPTSFVAAQLATAAAPRASLERAERALIEAQHRDGGWGYHAGVPTDADSTACALVFLAARGSAGDHVERAAACLARHQDPDSGGLPTYREPGPIRAFMRLGRGSDLSGWCSPHLEVTATAGRALAAAGNGSRDAAAAAAAWRYVRSRQRDDGSWHSYWWTSAHYPTLQAAWLARALGDDEAVSRAAEWALRSQLDDGGWAAPGAAASPFATALSLSILACAGERGAPAARAVDRLGALQEPDGAWPSHPMMRIAPPGVAEPDDHRSWRSDALGTGVVIRDQHRLFTTATCVAALALAAGAPP